MKTPTVILVRPVTIDGKDYFEYIIKQDGEFINFRLGLKTHESLKLAQSEAEAYLQKQEPFSLRIVGQA